LSFATLKNKLAYYKEKYKSDRTKLLKSWQKDDSEKSSSDNEPKYKLGSDLHTKLHNIVDREADRITQTLLSDNQ